MKEVGFACPSLGSVATSVCLITTALAGGCVTTGDKLGELNVPGGLPSLPGLSLGTGTSSAAGTTTPSDLTPAERRMRDQSRAFQRTVWEGALIGASAGALWGMIEHDDANDALKKALIGGAVGGLAGAYMAHIQKQYATEEDQIEGMIADVHRSNQETEELIASVREVIAEDRRRLKSTQQRYRKGQATEAELAGTARRIKDNQTVVSQAAKGAREQYGMFQGAEREFRQRNPGTKTDKLQRELDTYHQQIETLDTLADSIAIA